MKGWEHFSFCFFSFLSPTSQSSPLGVFFVPQQIWVCEWTTNTCSVLALPFPLREWFRRMKADGQVLTPLDTICSSPYIYPRFPFSHLFSFFSFFTKHLPFTTHPPNLPFPFFYVFLTKNSNLTLHTLTHTLHLALLSLSRPLRSHFTKYNEVHSLRCRCSRPRCLPGYRCRTQAHRWVHALLCRWTYVASISTLTLVASFQFSYHWKL